jgi:hypothetical protein
MFDFRKRAVVAQRFELSGQFAGDLLDGFGIEDFDGFRKRTERGAGAAELLLYFLSSLACWRPRSESTRGLKRNKRM